LSSGSHRAHCDVGEHDNPAEFVREQAMMREEIRAERRNAAKAERKEAARAEEERR
jgi:hypothetical protein